MKCIYIMLNEVYTRSFSRIKVLKVNAGSSSSRILVSKTLDFRNLKCLNDRPEHVRPSLRSVVKEIERQVIQQNCNHKVRT